MGGCPSLQIDTLIQRLPKLLQLHPQPIGKAIDIRIISRDLIDIEDRRIGEACIAQGNYIRFDHFPRLEREFFNILTHSAVSGGQIRLTEILFQLPYQLWFFREPTETPSVMFNSVLAVIGN